jgi:hypothetical protein
MRALCRLRRCDGLECSCAVGLSPRTHVQADTFGLDAAELARVLETEPLIVGIVLIHT